MVDMPVLRPITIQTKEKSGWKALKSWMVDVRKWEVAEDFDIYIPNIGLIRIPKGFIFDGASIPRVFWSILNPVGILLIPGLVHDFGYRYNYFLLVDEWGKITRSAPGTKEYWDELFKTMAISINGFKFINNVAWRAVQLGGHTAWNNYRAGRAETR